MSDGKSTLTLTTSHNTGETVAVRRPVEIRYFFGGLIHGME